MLHVDKPVAFGMDDYSVEHRRQIVEYLNSIPRMYLEEITLDNASSTVITVTGVMSEFEVFLFPKDTLAAGLASVYAAVTDVGEITITHTGAAGTEKFAMLVVGPRVRAI